MYRQIPSARATPPIYHKRGRKVLALLACGSLLSGCASLPTNAPTVSAVTNSAQGPKNTLGFKIVDIDAQNVATQPVRNEMGLVQLAALSSNPLPSRTDRIRVGDVLTIAVYEVGVSLFGGTSATGASGSIGEGTPTATAQTITAQVRENGTITLPYIGVIRATDTYPDTLAERIRQRLAPLSQSPQVQVAIAQSLENVVYISGAVGHPGRVPLTSSRERLLDVIAIAGGAVSNAAGEDGLDLEVHLVRGDKAVSVRLGDLRAEDMANLVILPGDRIELRRATRTFTAFGATDKVSQIPFSAEKVSLAEAVARATGPADARANARGVYLFRIERDETGKAVRPVVYHIDMMRPETYFLAQMFEMQDKDVILFANSRSNLVQKMAALLGNLFSPATTVVYATK